ncbi:hypothetical protein [Nitrososphaera viennensis]|uniref:Uncharacterized protein n=2 Tax=Nitrososphaera viennensis TaxID=1034015 RepID=A0A060HUI7_9ARCH|nr:hypothetical protein [Nitrososphaera viennensis]AIC17101.1 hypothetical protein NVIE_028270 [Nitrososphaera viennensis EN76]UVS68994.1 hypothetical protein NWT39_13945 [Nitrososphaera viennensis]
MRELLRAITSAINKPFNRKGKYRNPEYDDSEIEGMMRYFKLSNYYDLLRLLKNMCRE